MDGLYWKTLLEWMIWGYHHLRKDPYIPPMGRGFTSRIPKDFRGFFFPVFPSEMSFQPLVFPGRVSGVSHDLVERLWFLICLYRYFRNMGKKSSNIWGHLGLFGSCMYTHIMFSDRVFQILKERIHVSGQIIATPPQIVV